MSVFHTMLNKSQFFAVFLCLLHNILPVRIVEVHKYAGDSRHFAWQTCLFSELFPHRPSVYNKSTDRRRNPEQKGGQFFKPAIMEEKREVSILP